MLVFVEEGSRRTRRKIPQSKEENQRKKILLPVRCTHKTADYYHFSDQGENWRAEREAPGLGYVKSKKTKLTFLRYSHKR